MRKYYWYIKAYTRKHGKIIAVSVLGAVAFFWFSIPLIARTIEPKPRKYIGVVGSYTLSTLPRPIQNLISSGLTSLEPDGTVSPALAKRWVVEDDGKTYRFIINQDATWHDGQPVTPADINYDFSDATKVTTENDVIYKLPDTFVPFPTVVSQPLFRTEQRQEWGIFKTTEVIGIGDYEVIDYTIKGPRLTKLILDSEEERQTYRFYLTEDAAITAFKKGRVDILSDMGNTHGLENWDNVTIDSTLRTDRYLGVFFNIRDPRFNKNIRQALNYAMPKPTGEERAISPINPESWVYLEGGKDYEYDLERAVERILDEVPRQPLQFTLTTTNMFREDADRVKQAWESFGDTAVERCTVSEDIQNTSLCENLNINVSVRYTNFPDTNNFDTLLIGQEIPPDPDQYYLWHSEQPTNFTGYKNTRIDKLLEQGRQIAEREERRAIYQQFQQFFLEDSPAVFLRHLRSYEIIRD